MKTIILLVIISFSVNVTTSYAQDIIYKTDGSQIKAKVIEITTETIKYKNYDQQNGPIRNILQSDVFIVIYEDGTREVFKKKNKVQDNSEIENSEESEEIEKKTSPPAKYSSEAGNENATLYLLRSTGYSASAIPFKVSMDSKLICKLDNNKYSIHQVKPGKHIFTVRTWDKANRKQKPLNIDLKPGKTYYIQIIFNVGAFTTDLNLQEITESSGKDMLQHLKLDNRCL